jgi:hypothetical protein
MKLSCRVDHVVIDLRQEIVRLNNQLMLLTGMPYFLNVQTIN